MSFGLTEDMLALLTLLRRYEVAGEKMPTVREMAGELGSNVARVYELLNALEDRGYIRRLPRRARAIEILKHDRAKVQCPNCNHEFEPARFASRGEAPGIDQPAPLAADVRVHNSTGVA